MKRKFRQTLSACLIGLMVSQSAYGLVPALADVEGGGVPVTSQIVAKSDTVASWNNVGNDIENITVDGEDKDGKISKKPGDITINGSIVLSTASNWKQGTTQDHSNFLTVTDGDGLFGIDSRIDITVDNNVVDKKVGFAISGTTGDVREGESYELTITPVKNMGKAKNIVVQILADVLESFTFRFGSESGPNGNPENKSILLAGEGYVTNKIVIEPDPSVEADFNMEEAIRSIRYKSSDPSVATVEGDGTDTVTVRPLKKGTITVTATSESPMAPENYKATFYVEVKAKEDPYAAIEFESSELQLTKGGPNATMTLNVVMNRNISEQEVIESVTYISEDPSIAEVVSGDGTNTVSVRPVALGEVSIIAKQAYGGENLFRVIVSEGPDMKFVLKLPDGTEADRDRLVFDLNEENEDRILGRWYEVVTEAEAMAFS